MKTIMIGTDVGQVRLVTIYAGDDVCTVCEGWKYVDDHNGVSWRIWDALPEVSKVAIRLGMIKAVECKYCGGTGQEPKKDGVNG